MLLRNTDWTRQFIDDVARLGKMHVNHWQLMDQVSLSQSQTRIKVVVSLHAANPEPSTPNAQLESRLCWIRIPASLHAAYLTVLLALKHVR